MPSKNTPFYSIILIAADVATLSLAFSLAYIIRVQFDSRPLLNEVYAIDFFVTFLSIVPLWIITFASLGLYSQNVYSRRMLEIGKLFIGSVLGILIVLGYSFVIGEPIFP